jgi:hypothetical protein
MKAIIVLTVLLVACTLLRAQDNSTPPGSVDIDSFAEFAKKSGFDLKLELERVYNNKDEEALARIFKLSISLTTLDDNARAYGLIICDSLIKVPKLIGIDAYVKVLDRQPPEVQQRVRDFLYYPILSVPEERRKEVEGGIRKAYPAVFPDRFQFGLGDPVPAGELTNRCSQRLRLVMHPMSILAR